MKLLIVDDDPAILDFFSQVAEAVGVKHIDTAQSSEEALARVVKSTYDLITLDIRMPGTSGLDILALLRNMSPHAIIAVISAQFPYVIPEEQAACSDVMLEKPVPLAKFSALLDAAGRVHEAVETARGLSDIPHAAR